MHIEGSRPEWCISAIYHAWDTPFWSGTLDIQYAATQIILIICFLIHMRYNCKDLYGKVGCLGFFCFVFLPTHYVCSHHLPLPSFLSVSITLTLARGHKVSTVQSLLASVSHFSVDQDGVWYGDEAIQDKYLDTILVESYWIKGNNCCCLLVVFTKNTNKFKRCRHAFRHLELIRFKPHMTTNAFDSCLKDRNLHSRSQGCEKAKMSVPIISLNSELILMECGILLRFVFETNSL